MRRVFYGLNMRTIPIRHRSDLVDLMSSHFGATAAFSAANHQSPELNETGHTKMQFSTTAAKVHFGARSWADLLLAWPYGLLP